MQYFLAVDAGGTKTAGAIADTERELARAQTGTINLLRTSSQNARRNLENLFTRLAESQKIDLRSITRICIGAAGIAAPRVVRWIQETVPLLAGGDLLLCGDEEIALDAAFHGGHGVLVVAGTGSHAVGRTLTGELVHAGGWGPALADEGSGHWIGQQSLRCAFRARDEGRQGALLESILRFWHVSELGQLVEKANASPAPDFSMLAPLVASCAEEGDALAQDVLALAGEELARLASIVLRKLEQLGDVSAPRVAFTGGVLRHIGRVRTAMTTALLHENLGVEILNEPVDPISGALWRARNGNKAGALASTRR